MSIRTKDKPKTPADRAKAIRDKFDEWLRVWGDTFDQMDEDMKCLSMLGPWPDKERVARAVEGQERPCLHEDILTQFHNQVINAMEMNPHGADVQPQSGAANPETAVFVEDRLRQIDYEQNGQHAYMTAGASAVMCSLGYWEIETEYATAFSWDKQIRIVSIMDAKTVVYDPYCKKPDWSDADGCFKLSRMTHDEFRAKFPKAQIQDFGGYLDQAPKWIDTNSVQVAIVWERTKTPRRLLKIDDGSPDGWDLFDDELPDNLKKKGQYLEVIGNGMASAGYPTGARFPVLKERKSEKITVTKCVTNGIEILDETEFEDEEIPIMVTTGRIKYVNGQRIIDSLTRNGRVGQLLYDYLISGIQENIALTQRPKYEGYEGQFATITPFDKMLRTNLPFAEFKAKTAATGNETLPLPVFRTYQPPIDLYEVAKNSIIRSVQNAIGMSTTEAKERTAKSGKALESLQETMNVTTFHFYNALRIAQLRGYRQMLRLLGKIENTPRKVGLRDVAGNHKVVDLKFVDRPNKDGTTDSLPVHQLDHQVVIGSGKYYQSQLEKQEDLAQQLLQLKDPTLTSAVLPGAIRLMGLGDKGDELAEEMESIQPAPMQQVREARKQKQNGGPDIPPKITQVIQAQQQQNQQLMALVQKLQKDVDGETAKYAFEKWKTTEDNRAKVDVATISASTKERMDLLDQQVTAIRHIVDTLTTGASEAADRQHETNLQLGQQQHASELNDANLAAQTQPQGATTPVGA